ncbi:Peptidase family M20/M25/M40 [Popillia japonica]|uniref:N-acyl-aliphatic-L-amino acid amidohydrolase n=1 Tax=Popillia japonica TaxID=7064 RepID=A0AAW1HUV5_POPJA
MSISADQKKALDDEAVRNFQEYLRIPSVHPNVNYDDCVKFLEKQAKSLDLPIQSYSVVTGKPIVIITWTGTEPNIPSVMLNSHMDVVPVYEDKWTYKPFSAHIDSKGNIYARGSQDMKCVGIQYLEAVRRLKQQGVRLRRTIHMSFVPDEEIDEEIGGVDGMKKYIHTQHFKDLNIGVSLDEGMASPTDDYLLFYGERAIWHFHIHCPGQPGHGSLLLDNTAGEKVHYIVNKLMTFREQEKKKLKDNPTLTLTVGDVTTINLTQLKGGVQSNVVPPELVVVFDCRLPVTVNHKDWENTLNQWCKEAGSGIWIEYEQKQPAIPITKLDNSNTFWKVFKESADQMGLKLTQRIFPGGTDSRYVRDVGLPAFGFSPMNNTPVLLHDNDEYLNVNTFLKGIEIYYKLIKDIANLEDKTGVWCFILRGAIRSQS